MTTTTLSRTAADTFLRTVLRLDAIASGAIGVAFLAAAGALQDHPGTPTALTRGTGAFLVAYAVFVWFVSTRPTAGLVGLLVATVEGNGGVPPGGATVDPPMDVMVRPSPEAETVKTQTKVDTENMPDPMANWLSYRGARPRASSH